MIYKTQKIPNLFQFPNVPTSQTFLPVSDETHEHQQGLKSSVLWTLLLCAPWCGYSLRTLLPILLLREDLGFVWFFLTLGCSLKNEHAFLFLITFSKLCPLYYSLNSCSFGMNVVEFLVLLLFSTVTVMTEPLHIPFVTTSVLQWMSPLVTSSSFGGDLETIGWPIQTSGSEVLGSLSSKGLFHHNDNFSSPFPLRIWVFKHIFILLHLFGIFSLDSS